MALGILRASDRVAIWREAVEIDPASGKPVGDYPSFKEVMQEKLKKPSTSTPPSGGSTPDAPEPAPEILIPNSNKFKYPANALKKLLDKVEPVAASQQIGMPEHSHIGIKNYLDTPAGQGFAKTYFKPQYNDAIKATLGDDNHAKLLYHMPKEHHEKLTTHTQQPAPNSNKYKYPTTGLKKLLDDPNTTPEQVAAFKEKNPAYTKTYLHNPAYQQALKTDLGGKNYDDWQEHLHPGKEPKAKPLPEQPTSIAEQVGESAAQAFAPAGFTPKSQEQFFTEHGGPEGAAAAQGKTTSLNEDMTAAFPNTPTNWDTLHPEVAKGKLQKSYEHYKTYGTTESDKAAAAKLKKILDKHFAQEPSDQGELTENHKNLIQFTKDNPDWAAQHGETLQSPEFKQWFESQPQHYQNNAVLSPTHTMGDFAGYQFKHPHDADDQDDIKAIKGEMPKPSDAEFAQQIKGDPDFQAWAESVAKDTEHTEHGKPLGQLWEQWQGATPEQKTDALTYLKSPYYQETLEKQQQQPLAGGDEAAKHKLLADAVTKIFPNSNIAQAPDDYSVPEIQKQLEAWQEHLDNPKHQQAVKQIKDLYDQHFGAGAAQPTLAPEQQAAPTDLQEQIKALVPGHIKGDWFAGKSPDEQQKILQGWLDHPDTSSYTLTPEQQFGLQKLHDQHFGTEAAPSAEYQKLWDKAQQTGYQSNVMKGLQDPEFIKWFDAQPPGTQPTAPGAAWVKWQQSLKAEPEPADLGYGDEAYSQEKPDWLEGNPHADKWEQYLALPGELPDDPVEQELDFNDWATHGGAELPVTGGVTPTEWHVPEFQKWLKDQGPGHTEYYQENPLQAVKDWATDKAAPEEDEWEQQLLPQPAQGLDIQALTHELADALEIDNADEMHQNGKKWKDKTPEEAKADLEELLPIYKDDPQGPALQAAYDKYFGGEAAPEEKEIPFPPPNEYSYTPMTEADHALWAQAMEQAGAKPNAAASWKALPPSSWQINIDQMAEGSGTPILNKAWKIYKELKDGQPPQQGGPAPFQGGMGFAEELVQAAKWKAQPNLANHGGVKFRDMDADQAQAAVKSMIDGAGFTDAKDSLQAFYDKYWGGGAPAGGGGLTEDLIKQHFPNVPPASLIKWLQGGDSAKQKANLAGAIAKMDPDAHGVALDKWKQIYQQAFGSVPAAGGGAFDFDAFAQHFVDGGWPKDALGLKKLKEVYDAAGQEGLETFLKDKVNFGGSQWKDLYQSALDNLDQFSGGGGAAPVDPNVPTADWMNKHYPSGLGHNGDWTQNAVDEWAKHYGDSAGMEAWTNDDFGDKAAYTGPGPAGGAAPLPEFDWGEFGPAFKEIYPGSNWATSSDPGSDAAQAKLKAAVESANAAFPDSEKTKAANALYEKWFGPLGAAPPKVTPAGGGVSAPAYTPPPSPPKPEPEEEEGISPPAKSEMPDPEVLAGLTGANGEPPIKPGNPGDWKDFAAWWGKTVLTPEQEQAIYQAWFPGKNPSPEMAHSWFQQVYDHHSKPSSGDLAAAHQPGWASASWALGPKADTEWPIFQQWANNDPGIPSGLTIKQKLGIWNGLTNADKAEITENYQPAHPVDAPAVLGALAQAFPDSDFSKWATMPQGTLKQNVEKLAKSGYDEAIPIFNQFFGGTLPLPEPKPAKAPGDEPAKAFELPLIPPSALPDWVKSKWGDDDDAARKYSQFKHFADSLGAGDAAEASYNSSLVSKWQSLPEYLKQQVNAMPTPPWHTPEEFDAWVDAQPKLIDQLKAILPEADWEASYGPGYTFGKSMTSYSNSMRNALGKLIEEQPDPQKKQALLGVYHHYFGNGKTTLSQSLSAIYPEGPGGKMGADWDKFLQNANTDAVAKELKKRLKAEKDPEKWAQLLDTWVKYFPHPDNSNDIAPSGIKEVTNYLKSLSPGDGIAPSYLKGLKYWKENGGNYILYPSHSSLVDYDPGPYISAKEATKDPGGYPAYHGWTPEGLAAGEGFKSDPALLGTTAKKTYVAPATTEASTGQYKTMVENAKNGEPQTWSPASFLQEYKRAVPELVRFHEEHPEVPGGITDKATVTVPEAQAEIASMLRDYPDMPLWQQQKLEDLWDKWFSHPGLSDNDKSTLKSTGFQQWFDAAPTKYREVMKLRPGAALDDYHGFMQGELPYPAVPEGEGKKTHYDLTPYHFLPYTVKGEPKNVHYGPTTKIPFPTQEVATGTSQHPAKPTYPGFTKNPMRSDTNRQQQVKWPEVSQIPGQQELILPPGETMEPQRKPLELHRGVSIDLADKTHPVSKSLMTSDPSEYYRELHRKWLMDQIRSRWFGTQGMQGYEKEQDPDLFAEAEDTTDKSTFKKVPKEWQNYAPSGVTGVLDFNKWAKDNGVPGEQIYALAKKWGADDPGKYGPAPLSEGPWTKGLKDSPEGAETDEGFTQLLLDYIEASDYKGSQGAAPPGSIGDHWSLNKGTAESFGGGNSSADKNKLTVKVTGDWAGQGEWPNDPYDVVSFGGEQEIPLAPGAPIRVKRVRVTNPGHSHWKERDVRVTPHFRYAARLPVVELIEARIQRLAEGLDDPHHDKRPSLPGGDKKYYSPHGMNPASPDPGRPQIDWKTKNPEQSPLPFPGGSPRERAPQSLYRGVMLDMRHPDLAEVRRALMGGEHEAPDDQGRSLFPGPEMSNKGLAQANPRGHDNPALGEKILDHLQSGNYKWNPDWGMGTHWSTDADLAKGFAGSARHPWDLPVMMRADWKGAGEDPYREDTVGSFPEESEITLLPRADMAINSVQIRHPQTRQLHEVLDTPSKRQASVRKRGGIVTVRERYL